MDLDEFSEAQKSFYTVRPKFNRKQLDEYNCSTVPFVKLFDGEEPDEIVLARWALYKQLHADFHADVDLILDTIDKEVNKGITNALQELTTSYRDKNHLKTLFLLGSDVDTIIDVPEDTYEAYNVLIDVESKDSPNLKLVLKRAIFRLKEIMEQKTQAGNENDLKEIDKELSDCYSLHDMLVLETFHLYYRKGLNLIINLKETETFPLNVLEDFVMFMKSALEFKNIQICIIFNINTNISSFESNLKQSTIRTLQNVVKTVDLSSTRGDKYSNLIFQSFLNCVDRKLNLSARFVRFILDKMNNNNSSQNVQLLVKILDYSLMSYFFNNPYSIFIDVANISYLDDKYLSGLTKCESFLDFVEGMIKARVTSEEVISLLENKDNSLEQFFADFLVAENPINDRVHQITEVLENDMQISDYNLIDLYYHMLIGTHMDYLNQWNNCEEYKDKLVFGNRIIVFQELFTIDNNNGLLTQALFPFFRTNLEDNLLNCERIFPPSRLLEQDEVNAVELKLNDLMDPIICQIYKLYREANASINIYDFFVAFKQSLPCAEIYQLLKTEPLVRNLKESTNKKVGTMLENLNEEDFMDKLALVWFIKGITDCQYLGILRTHQYKTYEAIEKILWRGI